MTIDEISEHLDSLLQQAGCAKYGAARVRLDAQECQHKIKNDDIAHGKSGDDPFFNFVLVEDVGVFTFFEDAIGIYVIQGQEWDLLRLFDDFAMSDVQPAKRVLAQRFGKDIPDLTIRPPLSETWLGRRTWPM